LIIGGRLSFVLWSWWSHERSLTIFYFFEHFNSIFSFSQSNLYLCLNLRLLMMNLAFPRNIKKRVSSFYIFMLALNYFFITVFLHAILEILLVHPFKVFLEGPWLINFSIILICFLIIANGLLFLTLILQRILVNVYLFRRYLRFFNIYHKILKLLWTRRLGTIFLTHLIYVFAVICIRKIRSFTFFTLFVTMIRVLRMVTI